MTENLTATTHHPAQLRIALPKGRLQKVILQTLGDRGPSNIDLASRALVLTGRQPSLSFVLVKDPDIASYVERGAADIGVVGLDQLREHGGDVLEPLTTSFGACRMCLCSRPDIDLQALARRGVLRVATKYPKLAREALAPRGLVAEIIALQGSVELAVMVDLADAIVDLVETGATLRANGLVVRDELFAVSARVIVNRASWRLKHAAVQDLLSLLSGGGEIDAST